MDKLTVKQCLQLKEWGLWQSPGGGDWYIWNLKEWGIENEIADNTYIIAAGIDSRIAIPTTDDLKTFAIHIIEQLYPGADILLMTFFSPRLPGWGAKIMRVPMQSDEVLFWVPLCQSESLALYELIAKIQKGERDGPE